MERKIVQTKSFKTHKRLNLNDVQLALDVKHVSFSFVAASDNIRLLNNISITKSKFRRVHIIIIK